MIVDALVLLGENRFGPTLGLEDLLRLCDEAGIDRVVAAPARPLDYHLEPANETLAEMRIASKGRLATLGRVDPLNGVRAVHEAERCLEELGCAGLFLHPSEEQFPITSAGDIFEVATDKGVAVVVATGYFSLSEPLQVGQVAGQFAKVPIVMTTGGQINISGLSMVDAWNALNRYGNLHVLTNGEYRQDFIERLASEFDQSRVMFASFAPVFDLRFERKRMASARISEDARQAIEGENAMRLFNLPV